MDVVIVNGVRLEEPITIAEVIKRFGRDALISIERPVRELPPVNGARCFEPTGDVVLTVTQSEGRHQTEAVNVVSHEFAPGIGLRFTGDGPWYVFTPTTTTQCFYAAQVARLLKRDGGIDVSEDEILAVVRSFK